MGGQASPSNLAGARNNLRTMLRACYYTPTIYSSIIVYFFPQCNWDSVWEGLVSGGTWASKQGYNHLLSSLSLVWKQNIYGLGQFFLRKLLWSSRLSGYFIAIWECIGNNPDAEQWKECPLELKLCVMAWAWESSNTGTNKK